MLITPLGDSNTGESRTSLRKPALRRPPLFFYISGKIHSRKKIFQNKNVIKAIINSQKFHSINTLDYRHFYSLPP